MYDTLFVTAKMNEICHEVAAEGGLWWAEGGGKIDMDMRYKETRGDNEWGRTK